MKKLLLLILPSLFYFSTALAQNLEWAKQIGSFSYDEGRGIAVDNSGNVYTAGTFYNTVDFDPGPGVVNYTSVGSRDLYLTKMDANGNLIWAKAVGGTDTEGMTDLALDASGNVYITGSFSSLSCDFDPGAGTSTLGTDNSNDIFILKLDVNGNYVWAKRIGASVTTEVAYAITVDNAENVSITGFITGTTDFDPGAGSYYLSPTSGYAAFVCKLDINGDLQWANLLEGTSGDHTGYGITTDATGYVYATGIFETDIDMNPASPLTNVLTSQGSADVYVVAYDGSGTFMWGGQFGGTGYEYAQDIYLSPSGDLYASGSTDGTTDFDMNGGILNLSSSGNFDAYIVKMSTGGVTLWAKLFGGTSSDGAGHIATDASNNVFLAGAFNGTADLNPGAGTYNVTSNAGSQDMYISKLDAAGNFVWARAWGGPGYDYAWSMCTGDVDRIYMTGSFENTIDMDPNAGTTNFTFAGGSDTYILKLRDCNINVTTGPDLNICSGGSTVITASGATTYQWSFGPTSSGVLVSPLVTTGYIVVGTLYAGCSDTDTVVVMVNPLPIVELGTNISGCTNITTIGVAGEASTNYNWTSNPPVLSSSTPNTTIYPQGGPVEYYLSATNIISGCIANDSVNVDIDSISNILLGTDIHSCNPISPTLGIASEPNVTYSWTSNPPGFTDNTGNPTITPALDVPMTYYVAATHVNGGCVKLDTIVVGYHSSPSLIGLGQTVNLCVGDSIHLGEYVYATGGTPPYNFDWWNGPTHFYTVNPTYYPTSTLTFTISMTDAYGCGVNPGPLFTPYNGSGNTDLLGHISIPSAGFVDAGSVYAFRHSPGNAGFDTIAIANINFAGDYIFFGLDNDKYLIKTVANESSFPNSVPTYYGNTFQWDSSLVVTHGCIVNDTININVLETDPLDIGTGAISGYIIEEAGFGTNRLMNPGHDHIFAPGGPLKGVDVKLGKNPGGGIQARTVSDNTGYYSFDSLPLKGYIIYVDIPNLPMDSTRQVTLAVGSEISVQNNYFADSVNVYIIDTVVAVGIHASEKVYENNFSIFPNPAKDKLNLKFDASKTGDVSITLSNALGQSVYEESLKNISSGTFTHSIEVSSLHLKAGVYFISVINDGKKYTQRLVVM